MLSAKISNKTRKLIYRRDHFRCALCDSDRGLQIHHVVLRSQGGTNYPQNLITLCWKCHAVVHGTMMPGYEEMGPAELAQCCVEYVADYYTDMGYIWDPWNKTMQKWGP